MAMNSKESMGIAGMSFACLSTRVLEIAIQKGVEAGTKAAMDYLIEEKKAQRKGRYDRRLRNTRLLLKNYRALKNMSRAPCSTPSRQKKAQ